MTLGQGNPEALETNRRRATVRIGFLAEPSLGRELIDVEMKHVAMVGLPAVRAHVVLGFPELLNHTQRH